jgi:UDP-2,3-diacylglucosamine hydrolase
MNHTAMQPSSLLRGARVGLVAGWGSFPVEVAQKCIQEGAELFVVGLNGHADPKLCDLARQFRWMGVAKLGSHIRFFHRNRVDRVALAGKLFKDKLLLHGFGWLGLLPDLTCLRAVGSIFVTGKRDARDDSILGSVVAAYRKAGISMIAVNEIAPKLLADEGVIVGSKPSRHQLADIRFGWTIARQMGGLDVGQSITVKDQLVLAVEAIEGTDALIARTGQLCPRGGFTLVKVAKPQQDMRFDVPTIGPRTVEQMAAAGGKVIAIEAGMTILVQREDTIAAATRHGISIIAIDGNNIAP